MCRGLTLAGKKCRHRKEPYCTNHIDQAGKKVKLNVEKVKVLSTYVDDAIECPVCTDPVDPCSDTLSCGHRVHERCIIASQQPDQCCVCRSTVTIKLKRKAITIGYLRKLVADLPDKIKVKIPKFDPNHGPTKRNLDSSGQQLYESVIFQSHTCGCTPSLILDDCYIGFNVTSYKLNGEEDLIKQLKMMFYHYSMIIKCMEMGIKMQYEPCDGCSHSQYIQNLLIGIIR